MPPWRRARITFSSEALSVRLFSLIGMFVLYIAQTFT